MAIRRSAVQRIRSVSSIGTAASAAQPLLVDHKGQSGNHMGTDRGPDGHPPTPALKLTDRHRRSVIGMILSRTGARLLH